MTWCAPVWTVDRIGTRVLHSWRPATTQACSYLSYAWTLTTPTCAHALTIARIIDAHCTRLLFKHRRAHPCLRVEQVASQWISRYNHLRRACQPVITQLTLCMCARPSQFFMTPHLKCAKQTHRCKTCLAIDEDILTVASLAPVNTRPSSTGSSARSRIRDKWHGTISLEALVCSDTCECAATKFRMTSENSNSRLFHCKKFSLLQWNNSFVWHCIFLFHGK